MRSVWPLRDNSRLKFERVDFNSPLVGSFWTRPSFRGCVFLGCEFDGINAARASFTDCAFQRTSVGKRHHAAFSRCTFRGCSFDDCAVESAEFVDCTFQGVTFTRSVFVRTNFRRCALSEVTVAGALRTVNFIEVTAALVDLSRSTIVDSRLIDGPGLDLRLPDSPTNFVAFPAAFRKVADELKPELSATSHGRLLAVVDFVAGSTCGEIVDEALFEGLPAPERALVLARLYARRHDAV
ncbi:pentapeptide repeat-containing protein [Nannocystis pusilla]|uniref:Pentapeptide repeat-containing protein n=1 Tax=Nannocystis pusilla TaxID=889268 RepID=A0ABS7TZY6_9BACT|nr:pentapeptide repeat-containing protein [Nannocystis pusilla]